MQAIPSHRIPAREAAQRLAAAGVHVAVDYVRREIRAYVIDSRPGDRIACEALAIEMDHHLTVRIADVDVIAVR